MTTFLITAQQQRVLDYVASAIKNGLPPTRAEIGRHFGFAPNAAHDHLRALQAKGYIEILPSISRGIRLIEREES